jgi:CO/xanthine dehydrogenase FAD-binding subunit
LLVNDVTEAQLDVGAANTLRCLIDVLRAQVALHNGTPTEYKVATFQPLIDHLLKIANHHVRNVGSLAGNLVMAQTKAFASDLATILAGVGASVTVANPTAAPSTMNVLTFLATPMPLGSLVQTIHVPFSAKGVFFCSYKVAVRPQNSHALVNAAFHLTISTANVVEHVRLIYGVVDTKHAVRAAAAEAELCGKPLTVRCLLFGDNHELCHTPVEWTEGVGMLACCSA